VNGGGDFNSKVFQALPQEKKNQKLGQHKNLEMFEIAADGRDLPSPRSQRRMLARTNVWGEPVFSVMAASWFCEKSG